MKHADIMAMINRQVQAWETANIDIALPDFANDGIFISPGGQWQGHAAIREAAQAFFATATDVKIEISRIIFTDNQGAVEWTWHETRLGDGSRHTADDAVIFVLNDDKIIYWREYFDTASF